MKPIELSKDARAAATGKLRDYFRKELDQDLSQLPAEMLLDFISKEIGGVFYNRGVHDAHEGDIAFTLEDRCPSRPEDIESFSNWPIGPIPG